MTRFINTHREEFGVEPICTQLQVAPSTYYAQRARPLSARALRDAQLKVEIKRVFDDNFGVYGARKLWRQLGREGIQVGRDHVARLMGELGICGVVRGAKRRTTTPTAGDQRPTDLVNRDFTAPAPNRLWVADLTYVATWAGFAYVAFVIDAFSRMIVGWRVATTLRSELALDALEMAVWARQDTPTGRAGASTASRGGQYLAVRYTQRLADEGAVASVGSRGDSYDNALAEAVNGLYKAELIGHRRPRPGGPSRAATRCDATLAGPPEWITPNRSPVCSMRLQHHAHRPLTQLGRVALLGRVSTIVVCHGAPSCLPSVGLHKPRASSLLDAVPGRLEQGGYGQGGAGHHPARRFVADAAKQLAEDQDHAGVDTGEESGEQPVDQGAVDQPVDLIQPVAQDRDPRSDR